MLQTSEIKKEKVDSEKESSSVCTCTKKFDHSKNEKQVLVNFGLARKKVFSLNGKIGLHELFTSYVLNEPAFSRLLDDSYVVFQEFNEKFGTWVDVDQKENFEDGAVLTAVFFPKNIERDDTNPGSIRKRAYAESQTSCIKNIITVDLSDNESTVNDSTVNARRGNEHESDRKQEKKIHKQHKTSIETNEQQQKEKISKSKLKTKKFEEESPKKKMISTTHTSPLVQNAENSISESSSGSVKPDPANKSFGRANAEYTQEKMMSTTPTSPLVQNAENSISESSFASVKPDSHPANTSFRRANAEYTPDECSWQSKFSDYGYPHFSRFINSNLTYVDQLERLCVERQWPRPIYDIQSSSQGFVCKLLVNNVVSLSRSASNTPDIKEVAAKKKLKDLNVRPTNTDYEYRGRPYNNRRSYRSHRFCLLLSAS